mgnify:CR=1 FL=1
MDKNITYEYLLKKYGKEVLKLSLEEFEKASKWVGREQIESKCKKILKSN